MYVIESCALVVEAKANCMPAVKAVQGGIMLLEESFQTVSF